MLTSSPQVEEPITLVLSYPVIYDFLFNVYGEILKLNKALNEVAYIVASSGECTISVQ